MIDDSFIHYMQFDSLHSFHPHKIHRFIIPCCRYDARGVPSLQVLSGRLVKVAVAERSELTRFVHVGGKDWNELDEETRALKFIFQEPGPERDEHAVSLIDKSRNLVLRIDLQENGIYWCNQDGRRPVDYTRSDYRIGSIKRASRSLSY